MVYQGNASDRVESMRLRPWLLWVFFLVVCASRFALAATPEEQYRRAMSLLLANNNSQVDLNDALNLLRLSADQGYAPAQTALGTAYERGFVVISDTQRAIDWYKKAAEQGDWVAQFSLGYIYLAGTPVARDVQEAKKWLTRAAADPHDSGASYLLGTLYDVGQGTATDYPAAAKWYRQSAERGNPFAMENLAVLLLKGVAGPSGLQSKEEAYTFLLVAVGLGNRYASQRLASMESDLGISGAAAARRKALDKRDLILDFRSQTCGRWDEQYGHTPFTPPLNIQMQCEPLSSSAAQVPRPSE
jgi:TPR repeat protein